MVNLLLWGEQQPMVIPDSQRIISMRTYTCTVYKDSIVLHIKRYVILFLCVIHCWVLISLNYKLVGVSYQIRVRLSLKRFSMYTYAKKPFNSKITIFLFAWILKSMIQNLSYILKVLNIRPKFTQLNHAKYSNFQQTVANRIILILQVTSFFYLFSSNAKQKVFPKTWVKLKLD